LPGISDQDIQGAVGVLTNFLKSSSTPVRFAAARTLSEVAIRHPSAVSKVLPFYFFQKKICLVVWAGYKYIIGPKKLIVLCVFHRSC